MKRISRNLYRRSSSGLAAAGLVVLVIAIVSLASILIA